MHRWLPLVASVSILSCLASVRFPVPAAAERPALRRGTGALVLVVERDHGSVLVLDSARHELVGRVEGLGNLVHATVKFSRDTRYAYVLGREAVVSKIDLLTLELVRQVRAGAWSVGGAMTADGRHVVLSNYAPGEARVLDADTLDTVARIPAERALPDGTVRPARVAGLVDAPGNLILFALIEAHGVWVVDAGRSGFPVVRKFWDVGVEPYDALITPDGRYYLVGFLRSPWMGLLDLWHPERVHRILAEPGEGPDEVPLWKVPHLKGWALAGDLAFLPALRRRALLVYDTRTWTRRATIPLRGTALYAVARPDRRQVWVDLVGDHGDLIEVVDVERLEVVRTLAPGPGATHPQFTPKGEAAYVSLMDADRVLVYDTSTFAVVREFPARRPSGIFFADRAYRFGM
jgi:protein NirF